MKHEEIAALTFEYGGDWGVCHSERLLKMISIIGEGIEYNAEAVWLAAYLHDWGGYSEWMKEGVEHYERSAEVAKEFLTENGYETNLVNLVVECIANHHGGRPDRSIESIFITDADALDLLGVVGACRSFAMCPRNITAGYNAVKKWRDISMAAITLDRSREIAAIRVKETEEILQKFEEETFGIF